MYVFVYVLVYVLVYVFVYVCMYLGYCVQLPSQSRPRPAVGGVRMCSCVGVRPHLVHLGVYLCVDVCVCVLVYVCVY
jgi:hypothetical protein